MYMFRFCHRFRILQVFYSTTGSYGNAVWPRSGSVNLNIRTLSFPATLLKVKKYVVYNVFRDIHTVPFNVLFKNQALLDNMNQASLG